MTIVNAFIHEDGSMGLVGVDTEGTHPDGAVGAQVSKMTALPHLPAIIATRGVVGFLPLVFLSCATALSDLDTLIAAMPAVLPPMHERLVQWKTAGTLAAEAPIDALSVVLLGWSTKQSRVIGAYFEQLDPGVGFAATEIRTSHISPWDESLEGLAPPAGRFAMYDLAKAQCNLIQRRAPTGAGGGRFLVARLTSNGVEIRDVGDLNQARGRGTLTGHCSHDSGIIRINP